MSVRKDTLTQVLDLKYGPVGDQNWGPRMRREFGYANPDDVYESVLFDLITQETEWLDVGCGWRIFPSNPECAKILADRARLLVGLDPTDHVDRNIFIHEGVRSTLEDYHADRKFDLITLRMVAEHIADPEAAVAALARLTRPGGKAVILTVSRWSPVTIISNLTPLKFHRFVKRFFWFGADEDSFPTVYQMNTRGTLKDIFQRHGFYEDSYIALDDCRSLKRWRVGQFFELSLWKILKLLRLPYPERNILGIYRKII